MTEEEEKKMESDVRRFHRASLKKGCRKGLKITYHTTLQPCKLSIERELRIPRSR